MNLNRVTIVGRLVADPEIRNTSSGQQVANLRMATNRTWTNPSGEKQEQVEYHSIVAWGKLADIIGQYLKRGSLALIEGRLQTRSWMDQNNQKRYTTEIVAENLQMGPRSSNQDYGSSSQTSTPTKATTTHPEPKKEEKETEEDIPVINEDEPIVGDDEVEKEEKEVDLSEIPF